MISPELVFPFTVSTCLPKMAGQLHVRSGQLVMSFKQTLQFALKVRQMVEYIILCNLTIPQQFQMIISPYYCLISIIHCLKNPIIFKDMLCNLLRQVLHKILHQNTTTKILPSLKHMQTQRKYVQFAKETTTVHAIQIMQTRYNHVTMPLRMPQTQTHVVTPQETMISIRHAESLGSLFNTLLKQKHKKTKNLDIRE